MDPPVLLPLLDKLLAAAALDSAFHTVRMDGWMDGIVLLWRYYQGGKFFPVQHISPLVHLFGRVRPRSVLCDALHDGLGGQERVIVLPVLLQLALGCPRRLCRGVSHALCNLLAPRGVRSDIMPHRPPVPHPCDCVVAVDGDIHWRVGFPLQQQSGLLKVVSQLCG
jgi:hypothetical protein